jgi:hypothetical protein
MSHLYDRLADALQVADQERGGMTLFGLFGREDDPSRWDLLFAAPWVEESRLEGVRYIDRLLRQHLTADDLALIGRIVGLTPGDRFLQALQGSLHGVRFRAGVLGVEGLLRVEGSLRTSDRYLEISDCYLNDALFPRVVLFAYAPAGRDEAEPAVTRSAAN